MKKFYSFMTMVIMMLVSMTTSAQVEQTTTSIAGTKKVEGSLTRIGDAKKSDGSLIRTLSKKDMVETIASNATNVNKAPRKTHESDTWTSLGMATYTDDYCTYRTAIEPSTYQVEIQESVENPGIFRLVDPYGEAFPYSSENTMEYTSPMYLEIDCQTPTSCHIERQASGVDFGDGEITFYSYAQRYIDNGYSVSAVPATYAGTYADGVITFPESSLIMILGSSMYLANTNGGFKVVMPGVEYKDYSVKVETVACSADNKVDFTITAGSDVASIRYGIYLGKIGASATNTEYVANNTTAEDEIAAGSYSFKAEGATAGVYTVYVVSFDAEGNAQKGYTDYFYIIDDDNENWTSLGTTVWGEDIISSYYGNLLETYEDLEAEIQVNNSTPGYYRIVNPYTNWSFNSYNKHADDHNHYIYIHAEDPAKVWLEHSPVGIDLGDGMVSIVSLVEETGFSGTDYGTLADNKITFPAKSVLICEQHYNSGNWTYTNNSGKLYFDIPTLDGSVNDKLDFLARNYECSSNLSKAGDITTKTTYDSDGGNFTFTVNVAAGNTANRFWSSGGSQLRMYGTSVIVVEAGEGLSFREVKTSGTNWNTTNYTANGLSSSEIAELEGGSTAASSMVWTGNSTNFVLEINKVTNLNEISVVMKPVDEETTTYVVPTREAGYTMTATLEDEETKMTGLSLSNLKYYLINTGDITITKGENTVATIASSDITIESNAATITLDTPITEPGEYTITAPEAMFIYGGYVVGEQTITAEVKIPVGVENVQAAQTADTIYNLNGQIVKNAQRGLYIINGKKVVK